MKIKSIKSTEQTVLDVFYEMCMESCEPDVFEMLDCRVVPALIANRGLSSPRVCADCNEETPKTIEVSVVHQYLNATPGHEVESVKKAGEALQRLGRVVQLTGRDWNFFSDIVEQIEEELAERAILYSEEAKQ